MLNSDDLAFFEAVSRAQSLADAARKLDVTPSAVTQRLRALEARAGVRLVDRSGRRLTLTDAGILVVAHGGIVAGAIEMLTEALRDRSSIVSGHLRVAAPSGFGRTYIAPIVSEFARAHPKATVALDLSDHPVARLVDSYDVVIHIGAPPPLDATVTTLAENRRVICASPQYLEGAPPIQSPDDLLGHRCLVLRENAEDVTLWRLVGKAEKTTVRIHPAMSTNDGAVLRSWAKGGLGVMIRSEWDVVDDLRLDKLRIVLPDWEPPAADVVAILGGRHGRSARASAFLTILRKSFSPPPWRRDAHLHTP
jgi:DNA-binding transcriptional LysR family regulator